MYMDLQKYFNNVHPKNNWIIQYIKNIEKKEQM